MPIAKGGAAPHIPTNRWQSIPWGLNFLPLAEAIKYSRTEYLSLRT